MNTPFTAIETLFLCCIGIGFLYSLVAAVLGGFSHGAHGVADHGVGGHVGHLGHLGHGHPVADGHHAGGHADGSGDWKNVVSYISPLTVSFFLIGFGGFGLLATRIFGMAVAMALLSSLGMGIALSVGTFAAFARIFLDNQGSSEPTALDLVGCKAEVITGIIDGGIGAISYVSRGSRYTAPAKAVSGGIPKGAQVRIRNSSGNTFEVEPFDL